MDGDRSIEEVRIGRLVIGCDYRTECGIADGVQITEINYVRLPRVT